MKIKLTAQKGSWNKFQIKLHTEAAERLGVIKDEVADFVSRNSKNISEADVLKFVKTAYKRHELINDSKKEFAICAFGENTKEVHYFPKGKGLKLRADTLILVDIWARLDKNNAPYADMTWMFWFGPKKIPKEIENKWGVLKKSRDTALKEIEKYLKKDKIPRGLDIDRAAHDVIGEAGFGGSIKHTIGHSLGFDSPHGKLPGINWREYSPLMNNMGYTIEPGMYFSSRAKSRDDFGMRTEIDFYISQENKIIITTPVQKEIATIYPN